MTTLLGSAFALPFLASIDPFVIPLAGMGLGVLGIIFAGYETMQKRRLRHELLRIALEKGQPLPPELLEERPSRKVRDDRRSGLIALAFGGALFFFLGALPIPTGVRWVALIPGFIGVALLLNWMLERLDREAQTKTKL